MKNNKIIAFILSISLLIGSVGLVITQTGCAQFKKWVSQNEVTFEQANILLKGSVETACRYAIKKDKNAKDWLFLVASAIDSITQGSDYTPGNLSKAIKSVPIDELKGDTASLVVTAVTTGYELYFAKYGKNFFSTKEPEAKKLLESVVAGINAALK